jgi:hypothetical protein
LPVRAIAAAVLETARRSSDWALLPNNQGYHSILTVGYRLMSRITPGTTGTRAFATDARGVVFYATGGAAPANPIPSTAMVVQ